MSILEGYKYFQTTTKTNKYDYYQVDSETLLRHKCRTGGTSMEVIPKHNSIGILF